MRLPNAAHEGHSWVIDQIASDFKLLDVWGLPAHGGPDEFATLIAVMASLDPATGESRATRALFSLRYRLGGWFGWDDATSRLPVPGRTETTLSARVPVDLRDTATRAVVVSSTSFIPLYRTDDEWAAELSNRTVHAVVHLAWIDEGENRYRGQMGIYVKPRGKVGATYMALIGPFRHLIVYPALMRQIERAWDARHTSRHIHMDDLIALYDGDCGFCSVMMAMLLMWDRANRVGPVSIQSARGEELLVDMARQDRLKSWHLVDAEGTLYSGGAAVPVILDALPWGTPIARVASQFPNLALRAYDWIADHRVLLGRPLKARPRAWAARVIADRESSTDTGNEG